MDVFFEQILELCRVERTAPKWVLVRDGRQAHALAERVVREGTDWVNLRCQSLGRLAVELAGPFLLEAGLDPSPEGLGPALALKLLEELPAQVPPHFRPVAEQPRIGETLWRTLVEVRMAGLRAADLRPGCPRTAEFQALLASYERHLAENRLADRATILLEARRLAPAHAPLHPEDTLLVAPDPGWSELERQLLEALPGRRVLPRALDLEGLERPRRMPQVDWVTPTAGTDAERLAWVSAPALAPPPRRDGSLELFVAGGREAEVEEVLRRILNRPLPLDEVEIALANPDLVPLLWEKLERHGLPGTFEGGVPALLTRPGRGLNGFLSWVEGGFVAWDLRRWLLSGTVRGGGEGARLLERALPTWGRESYARAFRAEAARLESGRGDPEAVGDLVGRLRALEAWVGALLDRIPDEEPFPMGPWLDTCRHVVEELLPTETPLDRAARVRLLQGLEEIRGLGEAPRPSTEAVRLVRERLEGLRVGRARGAPAALHVSLLPQAGVAGRGNLFVLGLEEGHFRGGGEDPVLFDAERLALSAGLPTSADRTTAAVWASVSRLAAGTSGRVCLSWSCRELREGRSVPPSWLLVHAARLLWPEVSTSEQLLERLGPPCTVVPTSPPEALAPADWWLAALQGLGRQGLALVRGAFRGLDRGLLAQAERGGKSQSEFSGRVPSAAGRHHPATSQRALSASRLEDLGACPFRYFLRYVLGLAPLELAPPEPDRWLDARLRGSLLHEVYAAYRRDLRVRGARPRPEDLQLLEGLLERELGALLELLPPVSTQVFQHERDALDRDLQLFLKLELLEPDREPVALEVSFAMPEPQGEALDRPEPVLLTLGQRPGLLLRGRIDRIDRLPDGTYQVLDYKTGSDRDAGRRFHGGRRLQFALYALAARELLRALEPDPRVVGSAYYHPTERARDWWHPQPFPDPEVLGRLLDHLLYPLETGEFLQTDSPEDCESCDFRAVCGEKPWELTRRRAGEARTHLEELRRHA